MAMLAELVDGVIGVDTHRDTLTAAAVSNLGGVLAQITTSADAAGYQHLVVPRRSSLNVGHAAFLAS
jgi:transposase